MKDYIEKSLIYNARLAMKEGFDSLSDEQKKKGFIKLLDENTELQQEKKDLIKYLEDKITYIKSNYSQVNGNYFMMNDILKTYQDILERVKSGKYE